MKKIIRLIGMFLISFAAIYFLLYFETKLDHEKLTLQLASLGATTVILFGMPEAPVAQPKNVIFGHMLSAFVGVTACTFIDNTWIAAAIAVASSLCLMTILNVMHPPGGATAITAVLGAKGIVDLGYLYVIFPTGVGAVILVAIAMVYYLIDPGVNYPVRKNN